MNLQNSICRALCSSQLVLVMATVLCAGQLYADSSDTPESVDEDTEVMIFEDEGEYLIFSR